MKSLLILSMVIIVLCPCKAIHGQVINTPNADIEFIGLKNWSAQDLYDNIKASNPGKPFHACAVYLKDVLKFADAAVTAYYSEGRMYILVIVVEPQFASRIRYNPPLKEPKPVITRWSALAEIYKLHPNEYMFALQLVGYRFGTPHYDISKAGLSFGDDTISTIKKVWHALELDNTPKDRSLALETLKNDANFINRILALSVLSNFLGQDSAWQATLNAFCDSDARVLNSATAVLENYARVQKRAVDWSPAVETIRALLAGTNAFAFIPTLRILTETKISPNLAAPILKGGGDLLLDFLRANRQSERDLAHNLLVQLARQDLGYDSVKWSAWIASLHNNILK
jgi:hypothetical protein